MKQYKIQIRSQKNSQSCVPLKTLSFYIDPKPLFMMLQVNGCQWDKYILIYFYFIFSPIDRACPMLPCIVSEFLIWLKFLIILVAFIFVLAVNIIIYYLLSLLHTYIHYYIHTVSNILLLIIIGSGNCYISHI